MTGMVWKPDVTVASVVEREGRFLFVEERAGGRVVLNQPAGHLEEGESLIDAVVRETLEETAWDFEPTASSASTCGDPSTAAARSCASHSAANSTAIIPTARWTAASCAPAGSRGISCSSRGRDSAARWC